MQFTEHNNIIEVTSENTLLSNIQDAVDILGNVTYLYNCQRIILHQKNICPEFFDLKTRIAGDILQKFSNYSVRLAIVGDFTNITSKSLRDFIFESNKGKQINFVGSVEEGVKVLN